MYELHQIGSCNKLSENEADDLITILNREDRIAIDSYPFTEVLKPIINSIGSDQEGSERRLRQSVRGSLPAGQKLLEDGFGPYVWLASFIAQQSDIRAQARSSTMAEDGRVKIECFDGQDFSFCKMKLHEPLSETKPSKMKQEDYALLDRQTLGVVRLLLAKNVAFNVVNEKTTFGLLKALSNVYEKPSASNKLFLIWQLVNMKMTEGAVVADHMNNWSGAVTTVSSISGTNKMTFEGIRDMILGKDIRMRNSEEYPNSLLSMSGHGKKSNLGRSGYMKKSTLENTGTSHVETVGKKGILKVKEYCESWLMDLGGSFHATPCMGMMKNFKPLLRKVCLADKKVLDVAGIGDVVLKTTFGTEWFRKNVRYILSLKRKLISIGQLYNEGYHIGFSDQMWKAEKKNVISERLSGRICRKLSVRLCRKLRNRLHEQKKILTKEPQRLDLVSPGVLSDIVESLRTCKGLGTKGSVEASGSLGASLSIAGKEDMACVETLYRWVVSFDEVLVAESNMTKISKLKRWFSLEKNSAVSELGEASTCLLKN
ncbi:hypothetical protein Tco_1245758 [Tanacetum coccineum]